MDVLFEDLYNAINYLDTYLYLSDSKAPCMRITDKQARMWGNIVSDGNHDEVATMNARKAPAVTDTRRCSLHVRQFCRASPAAVSHKCVDEKRRLPCHATSNIIYYDVHSLSSSVNLWTTTVWRERSEPYF